MPTPYIGIHDSTGTQLLPLTVDPSIDPIFVEKLEVDPPDVRAQVQVRPQASGSVDRTSFYGAGAVTLEGVFVGDEQGEPWAYADRLKALSRADRQNYLHVQRSDWSAPRRILIRGDKPTTALSEVESSFQFSYAAPEGMWEAVDADETTIFPVELALPGLSFPLSLPLQFEPGGIAGGLSLRVGGTVPTYPVVDLYGPAAGGTYPIALEYNDQTVQLKTSAVIEAGHFWRIDFAARSVLVDGDPSLSRYAFVDFPNTRWWALEPGEATVALRISDPGVGCHAVLRWRSRWLP